MARSRITLLAHDLFTETVRDHLEAYGVKAEEVPAATGKELTKYMLETSTLSDKDYETFKAQLEDMFVEVIEED